MSAPTARRIGAASLIWGMSILLSRIIGLVREAVIGRVLGGGGQADVYLTSFKIPDFFNYLLAGGALSIVFIPIFGRYLSRREEEKGWEVFSTIANALLVLMAITLVPLWYLVPALVPVVAPGFTAAQNIELVVLTRIVLPAQIFHLVGGLLSAALQARDRHGLAALAPLLYTGCIIVGGLIGGSAHGGLGFAWGALVGSAFGPFGLPLMGCLREGMRWRPLLNWRDPDLRIYAVRSLPIMLGWSIVVVDDWFLARQGSLLGAGAIATVTYAKTLMRVPMGVFGIAAGVAAYPTLTRLLVTGERTEAYQTLSRSVRRMLVLAFASQAAMTAAGPEIARVIYGSRISPAQHAAIGLSLGLVSLGLWAWSAQTVVARGFFAMGKTWGPTLLGTAITVIAYPIYPLLGHLWGTSGLALASSVAISIYVVALMVWLRREFPGVPDGYGPFFLRILPALALGIGAGVGLRGWLPVQVPLLRGAILGAVAASVYVGAALAFGVPDLREVLAGLNRRIRRRAATA